MDSYGFPQYRRVIFQDKQLPLSATEPVRHS